MPRTAAYTVNHGRLLHYFRGVGGGVDDSLRRLGLGSDGPDKSTSADAYPSLQNAIAASHPEVGGGPRLRRFAYLDRRLGAEDGHSVHRSAAVRDWLHANQRRIQIFFLPSYSPELNPDEYLNNDVKTNAAGRQRPATKPELIANLEDYLRNTQRRPNLVKNYFHAEPVRYAAG